jgi:hypothetical protein
MSVSAASDRYITRSENPAFLADHGYPISHSTIDKLSMPSRGQNDGPPSEGTWGNRLLYRPERVLAWRADASKQTARTPDTPDLRRAAMADDPVDVDTRLPARIAASAAVLAPLALSSGAATARVVGCRWNRAACPPGACPTALYRADPEAATCSTSN